MARRRGVLAALLVLTLAQSVRAQIDLLTYREAEKVIEALPDISADRREGYCPMLSNRGYGGYGGDSPHQLSFTVRNGCGPTAGQLVENYVIDRRTGTVTLWGDNPEVVGDAESRARAERLIRQARSRALSANEAKCLALEAAKSLPGWTSPGHLTIDAESNSEQNRLSFGVAFRSSIRPIDFGLDLDVDLGSGRVRDDQTGQDLWSAGVGRLTSEIFALREPDVLTNEEALTLVLALKIPAFEMEINRGCRLRAPVLPFRSDEAEVGLACDDRSDENANPVIVNVETGRTIDEATGQVLGSEDSHRVAEGLFEAKRRARFEIRNKIEAACGLKQ
ncbi:MAG TPA: hypothetical protein VH325_18050 [Bryobacteraceae bacterium]|nr:hypothetical protein [Bryobacteraceae bacterium]